MNGVVYKIVCNETNETYYGSTIQPLKKRIQGHIYGARANKTCNSKIIINRGNFSVEVCEEVFCETRKELFERERFWIEHNDCVNRVVPLRTYPEFYADNQQKILDYKKEYHEKNRERILAYKKEHYKKNRDRLLAYKKKYREEQKKNKN